MSTNNIHLNPLQRSETRRDVIPIIAIANMHPRRQHQDVTVAKQEAIAIVTHREPVPARAVHREVPRVYQWGYFFRMFPVVDDRVYLDVGV